MEQDGDAVRIGVPIRATSRKAADASRRPRSTDGTIDASAERRSSVNCFGDALDFHFPRRTPDHGSDLIKNDNAGSGSRYLGPQWATAISSDALDAVAYRRGPVVRDVDVGAVGDADASEGR